MGASAYYRMCKCHSSTVPDVDIAALKAGMDVVIGGIERGAVVSCHDVSDGGLAVTVKDSLLGEAASAAGTTRSPSGVTTRPSRKPITRSSSRSGALVGGVVGAAALVLVDYTPDNAPAGSQRVAMAQRTCSRL